MTTNNLVNYAFVNKDNVVINVCVFDGRNVELVELIKDDLGAELALCTEDFGNAVINGTWNGQHFLYEDGSRVPPTYMPTDDNYIYEYSWDVNDWIVLGPNRFKDRSND